MSSPKKNNKWLWVFVALFGLALSGAVIMVVYNLWQQLKPEQLEAYRERWDRNGPANYVMRYTTRKNNDTTTDEYVVKVRNRKAYEALVNGLPQPPEQLGYYGMEALFNYIERFMELDSEKGKPRTFTRCDCDETTGAIKRFVRRVMGKSERLEILVEPLEVK
ncbi:MAG: DUF6174 domain-containing protein [Gemmataceae bacterium]|nr:DUF6174 domain-containing protein [Gemmataceae bacterium]